MAAPQEPDDIRASDQDRHRVAEQLHAAAADGRITLDELGERLGTLYSARTYGELAPLTRDLPVEVAGRPVPEVAPDAADGPSVSVAVLSGCDRTGQWVVPPRHTAVAVLGGVQLDLRHARFTGRDTTITAVAILSGIDITVPDHLDVVVDGVGLLGGFAGHTTSGAGGPRVRITGLALLGGVDVRRATPEVGSGGTELAP